RSANCALQSTAKPQADRKRPLEDCRLPIEAGNPGGEHLRRMGGLSSICNLPLAIRGARRRWGLLDEEHVVLLGGTFGMCPTPRQEQLPWRSGRHGLLPNLVPVLGRLPR